MTNKFAKAAAIAVALAITAASAAPAQARGWRWGPAVGGFVAGTMLGAAVASGAYGYPAYRCRFIEQYDQWGNYLGTQKVCRTWY